MTTETGSGVRFTRSWTAAYTRGLPSVAGERRRNEIESDIWEHLHDPQTPSRAILGRCLRGIPADVWWRYRTLLENRATRERNQSMFANLKRNWWPIVVVAQAVLGLAAVGLTAVAAPDQQGAEIAPFRIVIITIGLIASGLLLGGLYVLERNRRVGTWLIVIGSIPTLLTLLALNPVALLAVATVAGGLWTGNLAFSTQPAEIDSAHPEGRPAPPGGRAWYKWLIAAAVLFGAGFALLIVLDGAENAAVEGLAWFAWLLSWAAAAATAAIGVTLGVARFIARHRTRLA